MAHLNRNMPNALRVVCKGGLEDKVGGACVAAKAVYPYFQNYDNLMLPCLIEFCRRTGRPPLEVREWLMNRVEQR